MSAFIVSQDHIDFMVTAAIDLGTGGGYGLYFTDPIMGVRCKADITSVDTIGEMLLGENIASVQYRYPDDEYSTLPGPVPTPFAFEYRYRRFSPFRGHELDTIAQVMKAIRCYEYQSCEHPGWQDSEAKRMCDALRYGYIDRLPGIEDAEWEVRRPEPAIAR